MKNHKDWLRRVSECQDEKVLKYFLREASNIKIEDNTEILQTPGNAVKYQIL